MTRWRLICRTARSSSSTALPGADPKYTKSFRIVNELASQNLFIHQLLRRPTAEELEDFTTDFTIIAAPGFKCIPEMDGTRSEAAILVDYEAKMVVICGTQYAGEIKKSRVLRHELHPAQAGRVPHALLRQHRHRTATPPCSSACPAPARPPCPPTPTASSSAMTSTAGRTTAVFNFEGGCYAKCINLSAEREPEIYNAIKFGALVENVVMDPETREFDFDDDSPGREHPRGLSRGVYPQRRAVRHERQRPQDRYLPDRRRLRRAAPHLQAEQEAGHVLLRLRLHQQAGRHGDAASPRPCPPSPPASASPFLPLDPSVYAGMLAEKVEKSGANVYLVNTGWNGTGKRMKLELHPRHGYRRPQRRHREERSLSPTPPSACRCPPPCPGVPSELLIPANTWEDKAAYEAKAKELAKSFVENFKKYTHMSAEVVAAGPKA